MAKYQIVGKHGFPAKQYEHNGHKHVLVNSVVNLPKDTPVGFTSTMIIDHFGELECKVVENQCVQIQKEVCGYCGAIDTMIPNNPETGGWTSCGSCKGV